jgi:glycosyltransferase involved in cell wall biosynthesis
MQGRRGAEQVLACLHELYPQAPVYTLLYDEKLMRSMCAGWDVRTSFLQRLPHAQRLHKRLLPLMPQATERLPLQEYDLVLSSSSAWVKSVRTRPDATHICYCHSPARFLWFWSEQYLATLSAGRMTKAAARRMLSHLRRWDRSTCHRPSRYIANSRLVQRRIREHFGRDSALIYPPVDCDRFLPRGEDREHFVVVSALNPYKRVDLAVEACTRRGLPLVVIGDGPERARLQALAGPSVKLLGWREEAEVDYWVGTCRAFLMPQEEDFGIATVEAQSAGRPVIAYGAGGALETVAPGRTGLHFAEQTVECLGEALRHFEGQVFEKAACRAQALRFSKQRFMAELREEVDRVLAGR